MRGIQILQRSGRQVCQILTVQRCHYHDMSRACVIGTGAENFPEFEVSSPSYRDRTQLSFSPQ